MKGLLIKDIKLMGMQKKFFISLFLLAVFMASFLEDPAFLTGYMPLVTSFFALSTISYDEFDNGYSFLFTLPISRENYVIEKYVFALLLGGASFLFTLLLSWGIGIIREMPMTGEGLLSTLPTLGVLMLILALMLPLQLKFGAEKARVALLIGCGAVFLIVFLISTALKELETDPAAWVLRLQAISIGVWVTLALLAVLGALLISLGISIRILKKKEF